MNFNKILKALFGDKSTRDMKLIQPYVDKVKATYPEIKALSNDELRAKTKEIQKYVQDAGKEQREKIAELRTTIEATPIEDREAIFNQIDKLEKEALDNYEKALDEVMPVAFSIVKSFFLKFIYLIENSFTLFNRCVFDCCTKFSNLLTLFLTSILNILLDFLCFCTQFVIAECFNLWICSLYLIYVWLYKLHITC